MDDFPQSLRMPARLPYRAPRRTRSSSNYLDLLEAQVAHSEAQPDCAKPHTGRGVIVSVERVAAINRAHENRWTRYISANAQLNRIQHWNFREQPRDRRIRVVETLLAEETFGFFRGQIAVPWVHFPRQPIDT